MTMFFMLSGFVLTHRYYGGIKSTRSYIVHRIGRIYPVYAIGALATLSLLKDFIHSQQATDLLTIYEQYFFQLLVNALLIQSWFPQLFVTWNIGASWSVSTEAFFYMLFPFLLPLLLRLSMRQTGWLALGCYVFCCLLVASHDLFEPHMPMQIFYAIPIYRLPEFIIGMLVAMTYETRPPLRPWQAFSGSILAAAGLIAWLAYMGGAVHIYIGHHVAAIPLIAMLIFCLANLRTGVFYQLLSNRLICLLGRASYSFYCLQPLVLGVFMLRRPEKILHILPWMSDPWIRFFVSFAALQTLALISYFLLEEPMRIYIARKFIKNSQEADTSDKHIEDHSLGLANQ